MQRKYEMERKNEAIGDIMKRETELRRNGGKKNKQKLDEKEMFMR